MKPLVAVAAVFTLLAAFCGTATAAEFDQFGFQSVSAELSTHQAGAHPDFSTSFSLKTDPSSVTAPVTGDHLPYANISDARVSLPVGLLANLNAVEECSDAVFNNISRGAICPFSSQVGIAEVTIWNQPDPYKASIFRLTSPGKDTVARFGFFVISVPVQISVHLRPDYGADAEVTGIYTEHVMNVKTILWGVPGDSSHNYQRFTPQETFQNKQESVPRGTGKPPAPFMTNPTTCGRELEVGVSADSYQEPGRFVSESAPLGEIVGCDELGFAPSFSLTPTTAAAASPSGAIAALTIPQDESVEGVSTSQLRDAVIQLPEGLAISPTAADGLGACGEAEVGYEVVPEVAAHCPESAKIATAEIDSPSLSRPIFGAVYQRTPVPGHLTRAWLVADELGVHVKIPGEFQLDPTTGRITSLFLETPQVPLRELKLTFKGGSRGVLATPDSCGTYQTRYDFTPWSGGSHVVGEAPITFNQNCGAGGFAPRLVAGTTEAVAGRFSPLITEIGQASGEQNLAHLEVQLPPGVLAKAAGVPLCPDAVAATGACPANTRIGRVSVATGLGALPLWIPQPGKDPTAVYWAGPYKGAPYSLVIDTPAQAGPFDLGNVVVRIALVVNPLSARVTAVSDPLPQILEGIPITYRDVRVDIDRSEFTLNPTNCEALQAGGSAQSVAGTSASLSSRFQVDGCNRLAFKPRLKLSLRGQTKRTGHPSLRAVLTYPKRGAFSNIASARVNLPHSEFLDNANFNKTCTKPVLLAGKCPKNTIYGKAKAWSPLLEKPLQGPVYLVGGFGYKLPALVAELNGQIRILLKGKVDSGPNGGIRTTFEAVPDAPVERFVLEMKGGKKYGLLINSEPVCEKKRIALTSFVAQNARVTSPSLAIASGCKGS